MMPLVGEQMLGITEIHLRHTSLEEFYIYFQRILCLSSAISNIKKEIEDFLNSNIPRQIKNSEIRMSLMVFIIL